MATAVTTALIPAAGAGTRMRPFSRLLPKELVPLGSVPALRFVLAEAKTAGIERVGVVVRPDKPAIAHYLELLRDDPELRSLSVTLVEQAEPRGLAHAIWCARDFLAGVPFGLLLPDNFLPAPGYRLADLLALHGATGQDILGVLELDSTATGRFGNGGLLDVAPLEAGTLAALPRSFAGRGLRLRRLSDKQPGLLVVPRGRLVHRNCGRMVCLPHVLEWIERLLPHAAGELSEVPVYQRLIAAGVVAGLVLPPPIFDIGNPQGYLAASAYLHGLAPSAGAWRTEVVPEPSKQG